MLEENEYEALKHVVEHYLADEQKHFEEGLTQDQWEMLEEGAGGVTTDHIFCSLHVLDGFIKRMEDEGPRED